jgi:PAS domain-containing protein
LRRARSVLEQAAEGIVACDEARRVMRASRSPLALCGGENPLLQRFDERSRSSRAARAAPRRPPSVDVVAPALSGVVVRGVQARLRRRDGVTVQRQVSAAPLSNEQGKS